MKKNWAKALRRLVPQVEAPPLVGSPTPSARRPKGTAQETGIDLEP